MQPEEAAQFTDWIGRSEVHRDRIDLARARALVATLELEDAGIADGGALPPLWHWMYFWNVAPLRMLDVDGHPVRGGFMPPISLPRRMWAGGRLRFAAPLRIGAEAVRRSTILRVDSKDGRTGRLMFVTVGHEILVDGYPVISEEQDIVYREMPAQVGSSPANDAMAQAAWSEPMRAGPALLFRYSALTMNTHRIHYDRPYATGIEGYADLVVHGPLLATMLAGFAARRGGRALGSFSFRGLMPVLGGADYSVCGNPGPDGAALWVQDAEGRLCMHASAAWRAGTAAAP